MEHPSLAQSFYNQIKDHADAIAFLMGLANPSTPSVESEWLEFKREPQNDGDLKKIWSKVLSAFANAGGGVVVWGIEAKKDKETGVDCASAVISVENPSRLKSRLMELHHQATDPPLMGVESETYLDGSGKGFVVCHIPEGSFKPYRSEQDKHLYLRIGSNSIIMSMAVMRSMFYPRSSPDLRIQISVNYLASNRSMQWTVRINNAGTATAREVCLCTKSNSSLQFGLIGQGCTKGGLDGDWRVVYCESPIHPGMSKEIIQFEEQFGQSLIDLRERKPEFFFKIFAADCELQNMYVSFEPMEQLRQIGPKWAALIE